MRWEAGLVVILLLAAGCIGPLDEDATDFGNDPEQETSTSEESVVRTLTYRGNVTADPLAGGPVGPEWHLEAGEGLTRLDFTLEWGVPANRFGLEVVSDGSTHTVGPEVAPGVTSVDGSITDAEAGAYTLRLIAADGPVLEDDVNLEVTATWRLPAEVDPHVVSDGATSSGVRVTQRDGAFVATVTYTARGDAAPRMDTDVRVSNGRVALGAAGGGAVVEVTAWARAATEDEARERVEAIAVDARVRDGTLVGRAEVEDWRDRGAHAVITVPASTTLAGSVRTSNGPLTAEGMTFTDAVLRTSNGGVLITDADLRDVQVRTSNGGVSGDATTAGRVSFETSNGGIAFALSPEASTDLSASTSNGRVVLELAEGADVAYGLTASTSNGRVTEDMQDADYRGSRTDGELRTRNGSGRPVQVTGSVSTSNGGIHFEGR